MQKLRVIFALALSFSIIACGDDEPACGNGLVESGEVCDDGNTNGGDGCNANCATEPKCGNGRMDTGEQCDDGNRVSGDGCSSTCTNEQVPVCGDGIVDTLETCDDGNTTAGDGCSDTCQTETPPVCGDGIAEGGETCDDGNTTSGDGCNAVCQIEAPPVCGNGAIETGETCDDGNTTAGDGCSDTCETEAPPVCGNGAIETGETCDDGNTMNDDGCSSTCAIESCGDMIVQANESCDDGNVVDGDGCDSNCTATGCGNGVTTAGETCDDGNTLNDDGCSSTCAVESCGDMIIQSSEDCEGADLANQDCLSLGFAGGLLTCTSSCAFDATGCFGPGCGNGIIEAGETCDDGNTGSNDGCSSVCAIESCGDGITQTNEECDDANTDDTDGCTNACTLAACGDNIVAVTEECDDGNATDGDGCTAMCVTEGCGDGTINNSGTELCDDGNTANNDCCSSACAIEAGCELEPNNTSSTANDFAALEINNNVGASITPVGDVDHFRVAIPVGAIGAITAETMDGPLGSLCATNMIDSLVTISDGAGTVLATDDDNGIGLCSRVLIGSLAPGDYDIAVRTGGSGTTPTFDYLLTVDVALIERTPEIEPNDTIVTASGPFLPNRLFSGAIGPAGDTDFFAISINQVSDLRIETFEGAMTGACPAIDTLLAVIAPDGTTLLASDDDSGIGFCSLIDSMTMAGARHLFPGTYYVRVRAFSASALIPDYTLAVTLNASCGDAVVEGAEECDGGATCDANCERIPVCGDSFIDAPETCDDGNTTAGDGCSATCQIEEPCGNGVLEGGEDCDDGNTIDGDGCSFSTTPRCQIEAGHFFESEPNDDGVTAVATNDFLAVAADGPISTNIIVHGAITPAGDDDVYAVTNNDAIASSVRFDVYNRALGLGVACGTSIDTFLTIRDAAGTSLATNDDRNGASDRCSALTFTVAAGATVYAHVIDFSDDTAIPGGYLLQIAVPVCGNNVLETGEECDPNNTPTCDAACQRIPICGDGFIDAPETCEDGNTLPGDGCSPACTLEGQATEEGLNESTADADANVVQISADAYISGSITDVTDERDYYRVNIAAPSVVRFEVFDNAAANDCASTMTSLLRLYDSAGVQIITDTASGIRSCSMITFPFQTAGTFYIQIEENGTNANLAFYNLQAKFMTSAGTETEPNELQGQANAVSGNNVFVFGDHSLIEDSDFYAITVPAGSSIRAELTEGDRAVETCESNGIDSRLTLFDAAGAQVVDDDDSGRGFCSMIDGTGTAPLHSAAHTLAAGMYFVQVRRSGTITTPAGQFVYNLIVTVRAP